MAPVMTESEALEWQAHALSYALVSYSMSNTRLEKGMSIQLFLFSIWR